ncbi:MAG: hypothetical protein Q9168_007029 [Polycauliona sp. 1 TL-2023]
MCPSMTLRESRLRMEAYIPVEAPPVSLTPTSPHHYPDRLAYSKDPDLANMPHYETITYFWKFRPHLEDKADLIHAAYTTAKRVDPTATHILIRAGIHSTTAEGHNYVQDDPHITIAIKNPRQVQEGTHLNIHGYTRSSVDPKIIGISPTDMVKPDSTTDHRGRVVWPTGLEGEERDYRVK